VVGGVALTARALQQGLPAPCIQHGSVCMPPCPTCPPAFATALSLTAGPWGHSGLFCGGGMCRAQSGVGGRGLVVMGGGQQRVGAAAGLAETPPPPLLGPGCLPCPLAVPRGVAGGSAFPAVCRTAPWRSGAWGVGCHEQGCGGLLHGVCGRRGWAATEKGRGALEGWAFPRVGRGLGHSACNSACCHHGRWGGRSCLPWQVLGVPAHPLLLLCAGAGCRLAFGTTSRTLKNTCCTPEVCLACHAVYLLRRLAGCPVGQCTRSLS
jgi:hypothetical protein